MGIGSSSHEGKVRSPDEKSKDKNGRTPAERDLDKRRAKLWPIRQPQPGDKPAPLSPPQDGSSKVDAANLKLAGAILEGSSPSRPTK